MESEKNSWQLFSLRKKVWLLRDLSTEETYICTYLYWEIIPKSRVFLTQTISVWSWPVSINWVLYFSSSMLFMELHHVTLRCSAMPTTVYNRFTTFGKCHVKLKLDKLLYKQNKSKMLSGIILLNMLHIHY